MDLHFSNWLLYNAGIRHTQLVMDHGISLISAKCISNKWLEKVACLCLFKLKVSQATLQDHIFIMFRTM